MFALKVAKFLLQKNCDKIRGQTHGSRFYPTTARPREDGLPPMKRHVLSKSLMNTSVEIICFYFIFSELKASIEIVDSIPEP